MRVGPCPSARFGYLHFFGAVAEMFIMLRQDSAATHWRTMCFEKAKKGRSVDHEEFPEGIRGGNLTNPEHV